MLRGAENVLGLNGFRCEISLSCSQFIVAARFYIEGDKHGVSMYHAVSSPSSHSLPPDHSYNEILGTPQPNQRSIECIARQWRHSIRKKCSFLQHLMHRPNHGQMKEDWWELPFLAFIKLHISSHFSQDYILCP
jgi:hypothetical protein